MANNDFSIFAGNAKPNEVGSGIYVSDTNWKGDTRRNTGLLPGDFVSSIVLNTVLRQTSIITTLLAGGMAISNIFKNNSGQYTDISSQTVIDNNTAWTQILGDSIRGGSKVRWDTSGNYTLGGALPTDSGISNAIQIGPGTNSTSNSMKFGYNSDSGATLNNLMEVYAQEPQTTPTVSQLGYAYANSFNAQKINTTGEATLNSAKVTVAPAATDGTGVVRVTEYKKSALLDMSIFGTKINPIDDKSKNLNSYGEVGNYYCESNQVAGDIINLPQDWYQYEAAVDGETKKFNRAFTLQVIKGSGTQYPMQIIRDFMTGAQWVRLYPESTFIDTKDGWTKWREWSAVTIGQGGLGSSTRPIYLKEGDGASGATLTPCDFNIRIESSSTVPTNMNPGDICFLVEG